MVHPHHFKLESLLHLEFLLAELRPNPDYAFRLKPSLHPVLSPTLCFCGSTISDLVRIIQSFKLLWPSVPLLSFSQKRGSLFIRCCWMLTSHFVCLRENLKHSRGVCHFWSLCNNFFFLFSLSLFFFFFFFWYEGGLTCAR